MKWCIVGHGALASLWAHHLSAAGETVTIVTRVGQATPDAQRWSNQMVGQATPDAAHPGTAGETCPTTHPTVGQATPDTARWSNQTVGQAAPDTAHPGTAGETCPTTHPTVGQAPPDAAQWSNQTVGQATPDTAHPGTAGETCPTTNTAQYPTATFTLQTNHQLQTRDMAVTPWSQLTYQQLHQAHILIMVKAWQLEAAIEDLATHLQRTNAQPAAVILSHNGLGAAEKALQQHSDWPLYDLVTTHGAWRKTPLHVVHAGVGQSYLGPRQPPHASACSSPPVWFPALGNALPTLSWEAQILTRRWYKLAINCAINPLASLAGEPNGVLKAQHYHHDIAAICAEIAGLASIVLGPGVLHKGQLVAQVHQVIEATAENTCSMLQDIQNGNPTEIAYLNGFVARLGAEFDLPTPVNQRLYQAIETLSAN